MKKLSPVGVTAIIMWVCLIFAGVRMHEKPETNISSFDELKYIVGCGSGPKNTITIHGDGRVEHPALPQATHVQLNEVQMQQLIAAINNADYFRLSKQKTPICPPGIICLVNASHTPGTETSLVVKGVEYKAVYAKDDADGSRIASFVHAVSTILYQVPDIAAADGGAWVNHRFEECVY